MTDWLVSESAAPLELVPTTARDGDLGYPAEFRDRIAINTLHDGDVMPARLLKCAGIASLAGNGALRDSYVRGRDWGANLVAGHLAHFLGLAGHHRVNVARVVVDFNRFPGSSRPGAGPLETLAIGSPFAELLGHDDKYHVLEHWYDPISDRMEAAIGGKLIVLSVHTYDERNPSLTLRPEVSILSRSDSYQRDSRLPYGLFDPLFPDVLVESSSKRILRDRLALTLEKAGYRVEHNHPYCLPDGSFEIRSQPWFFFQHLRDLFEADHPDTSDQPQFDMVWGMLLNTNLRRGDSDALSGYLHRYRPPPTGRAASFENARTAYETIADYLTARRRSLVDGYRNSRDRVSTLSIEIRKDLVWRFDGSAPVGPLDDNARQLASILAAAVATYLREDRIENA
jgi:hypothetical protein